MFGTFDLVSMHPDCGKKGWSLKRIYGINGMQSLGKPMATPLNEIA